MAERQVLYITKSDRLGAHERVSHIGGIGGDGSHWKLTQANAIAGIEAGLSSFYVRVSGHTTKVIVATNSMGNKYLKAYNDGEQPNNLLSLPECP